MAAGHRAFGAARSVLDSREHDGILAASGPPMPPKPQLAAVYTRFLTAANKTFTPNTYQALSLPLHSTSGASSE